MHVNISLLHCNFTLSYRDSYSIHAHIAKMLIRLHLASYNNSYLIIYYLILTQSSSESLHASVIPHACMAVFIKWFCGHDACINITHTIAIVHQPCNHSSYKIGGSYTNYSNAYYACVAMVTCIITT